MAKIVLKDLDEKHPKKSYPYKFEIEIVPGEEEIEEVIEEEEEIDKDLSIWIESID